MSVLPYNRDAATSRAVTTMAIVVYAAAFLMMWGPLYVAGSEAGLLLWPLAVLALPAVIGLSIAGVAFGARGHKAALAGADGRRSSLFGIVGGSVLGVLCLPMLWFGNAPVAVFGG